MHSTNATKEIDPHETWVEVLSALQDEYGEATSKSWFSKLEFVSLSSTEVTLSIPTNFMKEWISTHYLASITKYWKKFYSSILKVDITISNSHANIVQETPNEDENKTKFFNKFSNSSSEIVSNDDLLISSLDTRYSFENFIVGTSNQLAHAAALKIANAQTVDSNLNPLFFYSGVGLGKTHLMQSIAWHIHYTQPGKKVIYISAEKFMYQFVKALRSKDVISFKEQFRSVDVLIIDDVQFICGKESTQEEFFHTFNALVDNNRQVIISCDRSPTDLGKMEERIRSRLGGGLVIDIHDSTYKLRLDILTYKADQAKIEFPKKVLEFLASKITSNIRELEGAFNKIAAHSNLMGKEITLANTQDILQDLLRANEKEVSIDQIQKKVADHYKISVSDITSARRIRCLARPRQIAMYLSKILTQKSLVEIGKKFGGKDHTTIMHAVKTIEALCKESSELNEDIAVLTSLLK
ncbi:MAG: chromosomal replication initiator protein DnaA [Alphaproteobacteria bacterium]